MCIYIFQIYGPTHIYAPVPLPCRPLTRPPLQAAEPRDYVPPNPHNPFASAASPPTNPFSAGFTQEAVQPTSQQYTQGQY